MAVQWLLEILRHVSNPYILIKVEFARHVSDVLVTNEECSPRHSYVCIWQAQTWLCSCRSVELGFKLLVK